MAEEVIVNGHVYRRSDKPSLVAEKWRKLRVELLRKIETGEIKKPDWFITEPETGTPRNI